MKMKSRSKPKAKSTGQKMSRAAAAKLVAAAIRAEILRRAAMGQPIRSRRARPARRLRRKA